MSTLGDLESRIYREIHKTLSTDVRNAVLEAVDYYKDMRFWFNEFQVTFGISLTSVYQLSTVIPDAVAIDSIKVYQGSTPYILSPCKWTDMEAMDYGNSTATVPTDYAIHHEMLRLYPTPSATTSAVVTGFKAITLSSSNTASNAWTNEAKDLIRHRAKAYLYASVLLDPNAAQVERVMEDQALNRLLSRTTKLLGGKIRKYL